MTSALPLEHDIEDIYALSPLQRGILFHSLAAPKTGVYVNQLALPLSGSLDRSALRRAFQQIVDRHSILRTAFEWEGIDEPVQVVHQKVELPWFEYDLRGIPETERAERLLELFQTDRARGFDLSRVPAMRLHLVQLAESEHVLCWTHHHILLDGWSTPILTAELVRLYVGFTSGKPALLGPAHPFGEYIAWLEQQDPKAGHDYFRDLLSGFTGAPRLPMDLSGAGNAEEAPEQVASAERKLFLEPELGARVLELAQKAGATPSVVIETAWALLLHRYADSDDVVFGVTLSGRPPELPHVEARVGLFINTLPLRLRFASDSTPRQLIESLARQHSELFRFQHTSLSEVLQLTSVPRGQRLFDTVVAYQSFPAGEEVKAGGEGLRVGQSRGVEHGNYAATLVVTPGERVELVLSYVPSRFEARSMDLALEHLRGILEWSSSNPDASISELQLVGPEERARLELWAQGANRVFAERNVLELFVERATARPGATALSEASRNITYAELEARSRALALHLSSMGVGPEVRVSLCLERGIELVVAILGILRSGGVYVPLDAAYPEERLMFMLEDCQASLLVTTNELLDQLPVAGALPILMDELALEGDAPLPQPNLVDANAAYVIYTSGSTGRPKGVVVTHGGLTNTALAQIEAFRLGTESRVLAFASPSFDASVSEMFTTLLAGATLYFRSKAGLLPSDDLADWLERTGITTVTLPPSALAVLPRRTLPSLATLVVAGEACPAEQVRRWGANRDFLNAYGPTETTICVSVAKCTPGALRPPIGRPIANVAAHVLDARMRPVPIGVAGELYAGGPGLARGYLGRPELTAERFVPNPFATGERLYRTGDRVRWNQDGELEFLERTDSQVKLRGYRIELGEIEAQLNRDPRVATAVVALREHPAGNRLVAYVVAADATPELAAALKAALARQLPEYMVPAVISIVSELPVGPTGKVDRRALPDPEEPYATSEYAAPETDAELALTEICAEVLHVPRVGRTDDFFQLGGDSLLSIQVVSRAKERGFGLSIEDVFEHPRICDLAARARVAVASDAEQGAVEGELSLLPIQRWFFGRHPEHPHHYNMALLFQTSRVLPPEVARQALLALSRHHDALRLRFAEGKADHGPVDSNVPLVEAHDLSALSDGELRTAIEEIAQRTQRSLNVEHGPLLRLVLVSAGPGRPSRWLWVLHHLVVDAVSFRILLEDFERARDQLEHGEVPELPPKTLSLKAFSERLWNHVASDDVRAELNFWLDQLSRPVGALPIDHHVGKNTVASLARVEATLDSGVTAKLAKGFVKSHGAHANEVLITGVARAVASLTGTPAASILLEGHGRDALPDADVSRTVGWFTSLHPVVLRLSESDDPIEDLAACVSQLRAVPRRGLSFLPLREQQNAAGEALRALPLPSLSFNYLGQAGNVLEAAGPVSIAAENAGDECNPEAERPALLELNTLILNGRLRVTLAYSTNFHAKETAERFLGAITTELTRIAEHASQALDASALDERELPLADDKADRLRVAPRDQPLPLSFSQERAWFLEQLDPGRTAYHSTFVARLGGDLDADLLGRAVEAIVDRHEGLRTTFPSVDGNAVQVVARGGTLRLRFEDLTRVPVEQRPAAVGRLQGELAATPFDLVNGPVARVVLVRVAPDDHMLVVTFHLILADRWSMDLFVREIGVAYDSLRRGIPLPLRPLRIHYPDYAYWQRQRLSGQHLDQLIAHWRTELADVAALELPQDRPRPATPLGTGARKTIRLDRELTGRLKKLGSSLGLTPFMTLLAAFELLLHRLSGQERFAVGTTIANRPRPELEGVFGYFANLLPFRADLSGAPTFRELLRRVRATALAAYTHQEMPFERIVEAISPERDPSRNPVFQVMIVLHRQASEALSLSSLKLDLPEAGEQTTAQFDLRVDLIECEEGLYGTFEYSTELFDEETILDWIRAYETLIRSAVDDPECPVARLPLLGDSERRRLLEDWNATELDLPSNQCLHEPFFDSVRRTPEALAVVAPGISLTYAELAARVNRLATELRARGVGQNRLIAVVMDKGVEQVLATLSILAAGGAYLPIAPGLPVDRIRFLMQHASAFAAIAQPAHVGLAKLEGSAFTLALDGSWLATAEGPVEAPARVQDPSDLAYVIYTSGSTGVPKGVALDNTGPANTCFDINQRYRLTADDRVLMLSSLNFDLSVWDIFGTLAAGATVVIPEADRERDPAHWLGLLASAGVTVWSSVPALFEMLVEHVEHLPGPVSSSLRLVMMSGDWIPVTLPARAQKVFPGIELHSLGGATEASVWSIAYPIGEVDPAWRSIPYGKPLANQKFYVLDSELEPCPVGVAGELYIAGVGLALGYHNDPARTAESFITHPRTGERLYRTGDYGRYLRSGDIEFLGRRDGQVKIRGYRIELGEIEAALRRHSAVRDAVVIARGKPRIERRLVGYVILGENEHPATDELCEHLSEILPRYMLPSALVVLEAFPLTPNGKVDRNALPEPEADLEQGYTAPKGALEELIAATWAQLLGIPRISSDANFFELGGHSILATQAIARLRRVLGSQLPLRWAFESPTIARLAARIEHELSALGADSTPSLVKVGRDRGRPLSFSQERAWFLSELLPNDPVHRVELSVKVEGALDRELLGQALEDLVRHHPTLGTRFTSEAGRVVQSLDTSEAPRLVFDRRIWSEPLSARDAVLFRAGIFDHETGTELALVAHRIVADRASLELALHDLVELYRARVAGTSRETGPSGIRFVDFAEWEREQAKSPATLGKLKAIRARLEGVPVLDLPTDRPRPVVQSFRGASVPIQLSSAFCEELVLFGSRVGAPLLALLLAGAQVLFEKHTGQRDFALGAPISGRHAPEVSQLVGPLENHFAIRALLHDNPTLRTLVERTRDAVALTYLERDVPFERVVDELQPERDTSRHAIFQARVSLEQGRSERIEAGGTTFEARPAPDSVAHHDVAFELAETAAGLVGRLVYKAELFDRETMQALALHFERVLETLVNSPELRVADVPCLDDRELTEVTRTLACSAEVDAIQGSVHERTFELARHTPDAIAVRHGESAYSYAELTRRAKKVAARLAAAGVGPEVVVGVLLSRTLDLPVALLGVLGAGGAYLPLEPSYPKERLEYILSDSGTRWVLTTPELAERVRAAGCTPIEIDAEGDGRELSRAPVSPDQLAYLIYTSGSTGRPKGVGVSHGCLVNFLTTMQRAPGISVDDRLLSVTSPSFDIFALELFLPLWVGASVIIASRDIVADGEQLLSALASATMMQATPATYRMLLAAGWPIPERDSGRLRFLCGGEALPAALAREIAVRAAELWNVYGPTETTVWSARQRIDAHRVDRDRPPPIGVPIGGTELYVLDQRMRATALGVWGELYIGGSGVARGYHGRTDLTAERFVPDPYARVSGRRLYRTGDRCRWRRDGVLEFQSRIDHQIKLRGHRIELGEIEAVLAEHPALEDVAVTLDGQNDDARLVGYVVPKGSSARDGDSEIVTRWREVWDGAYAGPVDAGSAIDTTGYASSYDSKDVPLEEMQEWLDHTVEHALELGRPKRVFEIGCGTGMVLGRLAEGADFYLGSDGSKVALGRAERAIPSGANVHLLQQEARDFSGIEARSFDCVVLNSVVQYFPDTRYLLDVLRDAVEAVRDGGTVFVGDVRSHALLDAFALSVELHRARAQMPTSELSTRVRSRVRFEEEQVLDPAFFLRHQGELGRVASVSFRRKLTRSQNELTMFRYDVVLHVALPAPAAPTRELDWTNDALSESALHDVLGSTESALLVRGIPDPLVTRLMEGLSCLGGADAPRNAEQLRARLGEPRSWSLARLRELGASLGFVVRMSPVRAHGVVDLAFARPGTPLPSFPIELRDEVANDPLEAMRERALVPELREHAKTKLPDYMLPQVYVLLDALPLTVSGKVDRRALPAPERTSAIGAFVAPQTEIEERVARIFADALRLDRVSATADFFALGGHSLLGTHVIAQLRNELDVELPLRTIFASPTVAGMAREVEEAQRSGRRAEAPRVAPAPAELVLPLSYAQERMWFIDRLYAGRGIFNIPQNFRIVGDFDFAALRRAFDELTHRHEALRTVVRLVDGIPAQIILPNVEVVEPEILDFSSLESSEREARIHDLGHQHAGRSFDLEQGPLLHGQVIRLAPDEHVVLITMHHIVADGWSLGVLYTELTALYAAFREGRPSPLTPLELQYADYAVWQRNWMQGDVLDKHIAWWKERLAGFEPLDLPTDRPRPAVRDYDGATVDVTIPDSMVANLRQLCLDEGATLFMGLTAAFLTLVHRQSGQDDITIGTALANRTRAELAGLIGFFINTPAVRADLGKNPTFRQLLRQVKEVTLDIYQWQEAPFEKIVEALQPERDPSRYPIYNVIFGLQNLPGGTMTSVGDARLRQLGAHTGYARYDLTIQVVDNPEGLEISWEYAVALFDESTVQSLAERFGTFIDRLGAAPDAHIDDVPCVSDSEQKQLRAFGEPARVEPDDLATIDERVFAQAERTPDAIAMHALDGATTSYRELRDRALAFAERLLQSGVRPEERVAIALPKSPNFVAAALGTLAVGACFVPLDPAYPKDRLEFLVDDSGAVTLITTRTLLDELPETDARVLFAEETADSANPPLPPRESERAAYIIYTSGSTGKPKGVVVPHRAVVQVIREVSRLVGPPARKNLLWFMSPSFDATILELLMTLLSGAAIHILPQEQLLPGPELVRALEEQHIDTFITIASALEQLPFAELPELHTIFVGGEVSTAESLARWSKGRRLFVAYGPTETTIIASMQASDGSHAHHTLGRPLPGMTAYCLDRKMVQTPPGVFGELYLGGPCVARGYHGRPELTAERFVPDPFGSEPGARLYKSGDRARFRSDGTLEFAGRVDQQIKLRGHRIELGEIEAALATVTGVRHAVVLLREDQPGDKRLVAYVVPEVLAGFETDTLKRELERVLPAYMVPSQFVVLAELPRAPTGKVNRKALAAPEPGPVKDLLAARTELEGLIAGAFAEVLKLTRVGVDQSFFDIGGHSLLATRLVNRVREATGVELPLRMVFEDPSVERLALRVMELDRGARTELPPLERVPRDGDLPVSFAQERLWFLEQLSPGVPWYHTPSVVRLEGAFDADAFERALTALVQRHESLRTTFRNRGGTPVQHIHSDPLLELRRQAASSLDEASLRAELEAEVRRPFDLEAGPLVRALVLSVASDDNIVCLTLHHIVTDGWSMGILVRELFELYAAAKSDREPMLPELPVQYADYAVWQRKWLSESVLQDQLAHFRDRLSDIEPLELPLDRPRARVDAHNGAILPFRLESALALEIAKRAQEANVTPFMYLLAVYGAFLGRLSNQDVVGIGFPVAGRRRKETEGLIGFFVNTLVVRVDLGRNPTFRELCARVRQECLAAYAHEDVPFERLVRELAPERTTGRSPLFQASFLLEQALAVDDSGSLEVSAMPVELGTAKVDIALAMRQTAGGFDGAIEYNSDLFDRSRVEAMVSQLLRLLEGVVHEPDRTLREHVITSANEHELLTSEFAGMDALGSAHARALHELVLDSAERDPNGIAIDDCGAQLSFAQLKQRILSLATGLTRQGVGPETRVAVAMERSANFVVTILAVLRAGGNFLPIDATLPEERRAFLLQDSNARLLVLDEPASRLEWPNLPSLRFEELERSDAIPAEVPIDPDLSAYVIYTSGSTGLPKGVVVPHKGVVNTVLASARAHRFQPGMRVAQFSSSSFDACICEIFSTLVAGATLCFGRREELMPGSDLATWLAAAKINAITLPPSALAATEHRDLPELTTLVVAGEECPPLLPELWARGRTFINAYGPTEVSICASYAECTAASSRVGIGRPLPNTRSYVLDDRLQPLPIGVWGELYVGGRGVARGYHARADLTADRFVPNPFSTAGERMYRTGDRARFHADGTLEFGGRLDTQIKLRGYRVEVGEIENALLGCAGIESAVVLVNDSILEAWVTPDHVPASSLRENLTRKLPGYMVPARITAVSSLPRTPSGKLDRRALAALASTRNETVLAPRTPTEAKLCAIYRELLGLTQVGVDEGFFEHGGHSLLAVQLKARILQELGISVPLSEMFQVRLSVSELGRVLDGTTTAAAFTSLNDQRSGEPVFAIHRAATSVMGYTALARELGDHPVYGVHPPGTEPEQACPSSIRELAARHAASILERLPRHQRVHLVGHSMGGFIALEIARLLLDRGHPLGTVALLDSIWPSESLRARTIDELAREPDPPDADLARHQGVIRTLIRAMLDYSADEIRIAFPIVLIEATDFPAEELETRRLSRARWQEVAGAHLVHETLAGTHESLLEPPVVTAVASRMRDHMNGKTRQ